MRNYLVVIRGLPPMIVPAESRSAARQYALTLNGFTPEGPAPRGLTIATV